jgi:hypothetical protein
MRGVKRRIEKLESKVQSIGKEADDRKAKLLEIPRLKEDSPVSASLLQMELKCGRKCTFADLVLAVRQQCPEDFRRV